MMDVLGKTSAVLTHTTAKLTVLDSLLVNPFGVLRFTKSPSAVDEGELRC